MLIQVRLVIGLRFRTEMSGPWGMTVETSCPDSLTIAWLGNRLASDRIRVARPPPPLFFGRFASTQCQTCLIVAALNCQKRITSFPKGETQTLPEKSLQQIPDRSADSRPVSRFPSSRIAISKNSSHRWCSSLTKVRSAVFYPKPTCFPYLKPS